ncbi:hypothetical protein JCM8097_000832 [Rhodosporidiobolus ruineniae]
MLPHQPGWPPAAQDLPLPQAAPDGRPLFEELGALDARWDEQAQQDPEGRITDPHLSQALPSLQGLGLGSTADGGAVEQRQREASQGGLYTGGLSTVPGSFDQQQQALPPSQTPFLPPSGAASSFPPYFANAPPAAAAPPTAPPLAFQQPFPSPTAPASAQEPLPAWLFQTGPLPEPEPVVQGSGPIVGGLGQIRSASNDYGQAVPPFQYPQISPSFPYPDSQPAPTPAYPSYPPPQPPLGVETHGGAPQGYLQQPSASVQHLFKQYWQQQGVPPQPYSQQYPAYGTEQQSYQPQVYPGDQESTASGLTPAVFDTAKLGSQFPYTATADAPPPLPTPPAPTATFHHGVLPSFGPSVPFYVQPATPHYQIPLNAGFAPPAGPAPSLAASLEASVSQVEPSTSTSAPTQLPAAPAAPEHVLSRSVGGKRQRYEAAVSAEEAEAPAPVPRASTSRSSMPGRPGKKLTIDLPTACILCAKPIARLILRGKAHEIDVPHAPVFTCSPCHAAAEAAEAAASPSSHDSPTSDPTPPSSRRGSTAAPAKKDGKGKGKAATFRKKNKRLDERSTVTACDVCLRDIAVGGVLPIPLDNPPPNAKIEFMIEVVCVSCDEKYRRCTDCGGGGGTRAGTGKWRSKELFPAGRKTCCLKHQRLGAFPDMTYEVWNVRDIPHDEFDELSEACGQIFRNQMLASLCIPEVLEQNGAIWTTFEQAEERANLGWKGLEPLLRYDIEASTSIRRYCALRTCTPNLRKTSKQQREEEEAAAASKPKKENPVILRDGKEVAGYILAEYEWKLGHVFLAIVIPWDPTGETFDATTLLIGALMRRVDADQRAMNEEREKAGEPPVPPLTNVWTMLFFKKESRMLGHLIKKRDFLFMDDFLEKYPETNPKHFPPHRPVYIPAERLGGWQILIRRQKTYDDGRVDDWGARRKKDEGRGKKKELKAARQKREEMEQLEAEASP